MSLRDLNLVTASISPSIQDVRELHALSPPSAARYALGDVYCLHCLIKQKVYIGKVWVGVHVLEGPRIQ